MGVIGKSYVDKLRKPGNWIYSIIPVIVTSSILSCSISQKNTTAKNKSKSVEDIQLVNPENITVTYEIELVQPDTIEVSPGKRRIRHSYGNLSCHLKNNNPFPVYYIKWTCDSYPGKMIFTPENCGWMRYYYCNGSSPEIIVLNANETDHYSLKIYKPDSANYVKFDKWHIQFVDAYVSLNEIREHLEQIEPILAVPYEKATTLVPKLTE